MSNRVMKVRVGNEEAGTAVEGTVTFFSMRLGGRAAARVKLDDGLIAALAAEMIEGGDTGPTPTELSFAGDDELEALSRAEAWVRKQFQVVEVQNTRRRKRDE